MCEVLHQIAQGTFRGQEIYTVTFMEGVIKYGGSEWVSNTCGNNALYGWEARVAV